MLFNSIDFALFVPIVFCLYWLSNDIKHRNVIILAASYFFYAWWDWRFLSLLILSTGLNFVFGALISRNRSKGLLGVAIAINLAILGFFKYFNFFVENIEGAFVFLGHPVSLPFLNIILPLGISFYTFQTLGYLIDIHRGKIKLETDIVVFSAYVSFFPQLVAGPIERGANLLPQFYEKKTFNYEEMKDGLRQILWGLFKKMVIADNCAIFADEIFNNSDSMNSSALVLGIIFFSFQIYGDFSGYSDIAIGTAKLFGFSLMQNFAFPYFSQNIAEFWRRWHISLTTWFRDYLYFPLGGSQQGKVMTIRNIFIVFLVSGFWHGANWTFIAWGGVNALFFIPHILHNKHSASLPDVTGIGFTGSVLKVCKIMLTFTIVSLAWVLFRAESLPHAYSYFMGMFVAPLQALPNVSDYQFAQDVLVLIGLFLAIEWLGRQGKYALDKIDTKVPLLVRWSFYSVIIFCIGMFSPTTETPFIYFNF